MQAVTDDNFESEVVESTIPVLVDFWAEWCGPCKALAPILEDLSKSYEGKVKFVKLDVESNPSTPPKFDIKAIPTLILFKNGQAVAQQQGLTGKANLAKFLDNNI